MSDETPPQTSASRRRLSRRSIALIAAAGVIVLALAGTAVVFAMTSQSPASPTSEPTPPRSPTPSATPTAEPVSRPASRFDAACDDLLTAGTAAAAVGQTVAPTHSAISSLLGAAQVQVGMWECTWSVAPEDSDADRLTVTLVPGMTEGIDRYFEAPPGSVDCFDHEGTTYCSQDTLVGDVWVSLWLVDGRGDDASGIISSATAEVAAAVAKLPPAAERWVPPTTSLTTEVMESLDPAIVAAAFALPDAFATGTDISGKIAYAMNEAGLVWPDWTSYGGERYVQISTLPGGGWAAADLAQGAGATPVVVAGTEDASMTTTSDDVSICFSIRASGMCVSEAGADPSTLLEQTRAFVAALPTS